MAETSSHIAPAKRPRRPRKLADEPRKPGGRSALSNGRLLADVDGRGMWARRLADLVALHLSDLGDLDAVSEAERSLVRRVATLEIELEKLEASFAQAGQADPADLDLYSRVSGNVRRILESLGLKRVAKQIDPVADYLRRKREAEAAEAEAAAKQVAGTPARDSALPCLGGFKNSAEDILDQ
jgi:hypothetical protein